MCVFFLVLSYEKNVFVLLILSKLPLCVLLILSMLPLCILLILSMLPLCVLLILSMLPLCVLLILSMLPLRPSFISNSNSRLQKKNSKQKKMRTKIVNSKSTLESRYKNFGEGGGEIFIGGSKYKYS